jgi:hypothetical protein
VARIRSVKPEFWSDDKIVDVINRDPKAALLYIGLWNFADDDGYVAAAPRQIKRLVFPESKADVAALVGILIEFGLVEKFTSTQGPLWGVPAFRKHQTPNRPTPTKFTDIASANERSVSPTANSVSTPSGVERIGVGVETSPKATETDFERAWSRWPKKTERAKSLEKFLVVSRRRGIEQTVADIIRFGDAYARTTEKKFVPALVVWLNHERWDDELPAATGGSAPAYVVAPKPPEGKQWAVDVMEDDFDVLV